MVMPYHPYMHFLQLTMMFQVLSWFRQSREWKKEWVAMLIPACLFYTVNHTTKTSTTKIRPVKSSPRNVVYLKSTIIINQWYSDNQHTNKLLLLRTDIVKPYFLILFLIPHIHTHKHNCPQPPTTHHLPLPNLPMYHYRFGEGFFKCQLNCLQWEIT